MSLPSLLSVSFLHHTSWQVDDVDDVDCGACAMLERRAPVACSPGDRRHRPRSCTPTTWPP